MNEVIINDALPAKWELVKLGDIALKKSLKVLPTDQPNAKFIGMDCIEPHTLRPSFTYQFNEFKSSGNYFEKGQLLYGRMRPYLNKVYRAEFNGVCSGEFIILQCIPNFNPDLLKYILHGRDFVKFANHKTSGDRPRISYEEIAEYPIGLPPLEQQQAIVSKIEELLSELDKGKQQLETAQQQLKIYRQAVLKWAFEGKLTNENVKEGELPEGWRRVKNKEILKYVTSGSRDWKQYYSNKGSRFVRTQDINSNRLEISEAAYVDLPDKVEGKRSLIEEGDILMTITGANVGKVAVVDFPIKDSYVSQSVALLKYHDKRITKFLWYYFQAQGFGKSSIDKLVYGVGRPVLSLENMREVDIVMPSIEEQKLIVQEIESRLSVCDKVEETITTSLAQAETLWQSILKKAFEGKLV